MKCIRCKKELTEKTTDFSLKVMLCNSCSVKVQRARDRIRSELEVLVTTLDDTMRFAVLSGELPSETATRSELLQFIVTKDEKCHQATPSSRNTELLAPTADGRSASSKLLAQG
jgi:hypothetical protein